MPPPGGDAWGESSIRGKTHTYILQYIVFCVSYGTVLDNNAAVCMFSAELAKAKQLILVLLWIYKSSKL